MKPIATTLQGKLLVEMTKREWETIVQGFPLFLNDDLGTQLRQYREQEDLSQARLAERLEISRNYLSMIERGIATNLTLNLRQRVQKVIGL